MTDPKEPVPDVTEPIPPVDDEAVRAEAEAAAQAADEIGGEDETVVRAADDGETAHAETIDEQPLDADITDEAALEEEPEEDEADELEDETSPVVAGARGEPLVGAAALAGRKGRAAPATAAAPVPEPAIRINDRASKIFVVATVLVFALIFLNGMLLGTGGTFRPYVPPTPAPSIEPSAEPSPSESASPAASGSGAPSPSPGPSGSAAASGSAPAASGSPVPS